MYDLLAGDYHVIAGDTPWDETVREHASLLQRLLTEEFGIAPPADILDCSCGIGTQAIGLALLGYRVVASDISPKSIDRAVHEAKRVGAAVRFRVADFRQLQIIEGDFDAVLSWENAIAYVPDTDALFQVFDSMRSKLRDGGRILVSTRDYGRLLTNNCPSSTPPSVYRDESGECVYFQLWNWSEDKTTYVQRIFLLHGTADGDGEPIHWRTQMYRSKMRAFVRAEILSALDRAGFDDIRWFTPDSITYGMLAFSARRAR